TRASAEPAAGIAVRVGSFLSLREVNDDDHRLPVAAVAGGRPRRRPLRLARRGARRGRDRGGRAASGRRRPDAGRDPRPRRRDRAPGLSRGSQFTQVTPAAEIPVVAAPVGAEVTTGAGVVVAVPVGTTGEVGAALGVGAALLAAAESVSAIVL